MSKNKKGIKVKPKYTFEDWINDNIPYSEILNVTVDGPDNYFDNEAWYPLELNLNGYMDFEEYKKTEELQFKCYLLAQEYYLKVEKDRIEADLKFALDKKDYLMGVERELQKKLDDINFGRLREIKAGGFCLYGLTAERCREILSSYERNWENHTIGLTWWDAPHFGLEPNVYLDESIDYRLFLEVKKQLAEMEGQSQIDSELSPDLMAAINIVAMKSKHPADIVKKTLKESYLTKASHSQVMEATGGNIKPNTFTEMKNRVDIECRKIAAERSTNK